MKIKVDENLPLMVAAVLESLRHDVQTTIQEGLKGCSDVEVWTAAQREQRFLITQDLDFSDVRSFRPGTHAGILLIRLSNPRWTVLARRIDELFRSESVDTWRGCFVVATDRKLRVVRPR